MTTWRTGTGRGYRPGCPPGSPTAGLGRGGRTGADLGFDTGALLAAIERQADVESAIGAGSPVLLATEPTETATAEVCAHTAVLAGRPENVEPLREVGRRFGRVAHLLDAVEDLEADAARAACNPLTATGTPLAEARRLCDDAVLGIRRALRQVTFAGGGLVHALLGHELEHSVTRAFAHARKKREKRENRGGLWFWPTIEDPPRRRGFVLGCCAFTWMCCTCQLCNRNPYPGPWSGRRRESCGDPNTSCPCDCCDCSC